MTNNIVNVWSAMVDLEKETILMDGVLPTGFQGDHPDGSVQSHVRETVFNTLEYLGVDAREVRNVQVCASESDPRPRKPFFRKLRRMLFGRFAIGSHRRSE